MSRAGRRLHSWLDVPPDSDFPLAALPYCVFRPGSGGGRVGVGIGDAVVDLAALQAAGGLAGPVPLPEGVFSRPSLNSFLALGRFAWDTVRGRLMQLLGDPAHRPLVAPALHRRHDVDLLLPLEVGTFVDFYSSIEHATNLGRIFRPESEPLLPNWRHLPVGYHGRASTVVVSGTDVIRPRGQVRSGDAPPRLAATSMLDFELEVGFVTGPGNDLGVPIPAHEAAERVFGLVLVNDWSARDIQRWEYQPLGPFLGKSFATSISPWVVPLAALEPWRVPAPPQDPPPLPYLRVEGDWAIDLELEVALTPRGGEATVVCRTNLRHMYWTIPQQLAHVTVNGATVRPGDLYASGTISGPDPGSGGSLIELTWGGTRPLLLADGSRRTFLEDGDIVTITGACRRGSARVGFGQVTGTIVPARPP